MRQLVQISTRLQTHGKVRVIFLRYLSALDSLHPRLTAAKGHLFLTGENVAKVPDTMRASVSIMLESLLRARKYPESYISAGRELGVEDLQDLEQLIKRTARSYTALSVSRTMSQHLAATHPTSLACAVLMKCDRALGLLRRQDTSSLTYEQSQQREASVKEMCQDKIAGIWLIRECAIGSLDMIEIKKISAHDRQ